MTVIAAKQVGTHDTQIDPEQYQQDYPKLLKMHHDALEADPTWQFFGGVLKIENRQYQVC